MGVMGREQQSAQIAMVQEDDFSNAGVWNLSGLSRECSIPISTTWVWVLKENAGTSLGTLLLLWTNTSFRDVWIGAGVEILLAIFVADGTC